MDIAELIRHPQQMDRDTLYELRSMLALHPYFQTVRLLMLQNLYLLHDSTFNEELRRASLYITDRKVIFLMIEAAHYQQGTAASSAAVDAPKASNRTETLINTFLDSIPAEKEESKPKRRPTPADAAVDYVAYLMETEMQDNTKESPQLKGHDLIDTFLEQERGRILLNDLPTPETEKSTAEEEDNVEEEYFTETLARIYIKQGRYQKALDIIGRLNQQFPGKNAYFADQMRFLEKLIINNNNKKN